jgi:hypothetical protein
MLTDIVTPKYWMMIIFIMATLLAILIIKIVQDAADEKEKGHKSYHNFRKE